MRVLRARLFELEREKREQEIEAQSGEKAEIEWGSQIRSYVLHPYKLVKDHRTGEETANVHEVPRQRFVDGAFQLAVARLLREVDERPGGARHRQPSQVPHVTWLDQSRAMYPQPGPRSAPRRPHRHVDR